jgi:hypothetical protein
LARQFISAGKAAAAAVSPPEFRQEEQHQGSRQWDGDDENLLGEISQVKKEEDDWAHTHTLADGILFSSRDQKLR